MRDFQDKRHYVRSLKEFYTTLLIYGIISVTSILAWLSTGGGFWPIWVMMGLGLSALFQGIQLGLVPFLIDLFPFLKPEWEEERIEFLMKQEDPFVENQQVAERRKKGEKTDK